MHRKELAITGGDPRDGPIVGKMAGFYPTESADKDATGGLQNVIDSVGGVG